MKKKFGRILTDLHDSRALERGSQHNLPNLMASALCGSAGCASRKLQTQILTKAGEVGLRILRLRTWSFAKQIIESHKIKQGSIEEALTEIHLLRVSIRRVENITEIL